MMEKHGMQTGHIQQDARYPTGYVSVTMRADGGHDFDIVRDVAYDSIAVTGEMPSLAAARQLGGKELSYNNILDADAALQMALEFDRTCCVIVKHNNPCGAAVAGTLPRAFELALAGDPVSAFGGILATNRTFDQATAAAVVASGTFLEVIVAPVVEPSAMAELQQAKWGKNVRVLELGGVPDEATQRRLGVRPVSGGFLVQTADLPQSEPDYRCVTARAPSAAETAALAFAWRLCKHVKSNAILLVQTADDGAHHAVGVGAGQMSRVDSAKIAVDKAGARAKGAVVASDAFFPFPDGLLVCAAAGATAFAQPGGSIRDKDVIAAADERGVAMVFTGRRHFRH